MARNMPRINVAGKTRQYLDKSLHSTDMYWLFTGDNKELVSEFFTRCKIVEDLTAGGSVKGG
jgi:hypothetical protein